MAITSGVGLVSGLNFNDIVSQLMELERRPIRDQEVRRLTMESKQEAFQTVDLRLNALRDALRSLDSPFDFQKRSISVSDESALEVAATNNADLGSYSIQALQLAAHERRASQGVESSTETSIASAAGTFEFQVGDGSVISIDVNETSAMSDLRDAINDADAGVSATIVNDGSATNPYRLILSSDETGLDHAITVVNNDTTLDFTNTVIEDAVADDGNQFDGSLSVSGTYTGEGTANAIIEITSAGAVGAAQFRVSLDGGLTWTSNDAFTADGTAQDIGEGIEVAFAAGTADLAVGDRFAIDAFNPELQEAQDARLDINGVTVTRSTNTFSDAAPGLNIKLKETTAAPVTVTVEADDSKMAPAVTEFITAYNSLITEINTLTQFSVEEETAQALYGESSIRSLKTSLGSLISSGVPTADGLASLSGIGVKTLRNGTLELDAGRLSQAISDDPDMVRKAFARIGESDTAGIKYLGATDASQSGTYSVSITQAAERARLTASQQLVGGLAQDEDLTIQLGDDSVLVSLNAGDTLSDVISRINDDLSDAGIDAEAVNEDGYLLIRSTEYGSDVELSVVSDQSGAGSAGFSTTKATDSGEDVAGYIGGRIARGAGQILTGATGSESEGLQLTITSTTTISGSVTLSRGVAASMLQKLSSYTDSADGILTARKEGLSDSIEDIDDRIRRLEDRMSAKEEALRQRFARLETTLAQFQSQGDFLAQQLAQLPGAG